MTVDIGDGRVDTIIVHEGDRYEDLALEFQVKHNLIPEVVGPLADHIRSNIESPPSPIEKKKQKTSNHLNRSTVSSTSNYDSFYYANKKEEPEKTSLNRLAAKKKNQKLLSNNPYFMKPVFDRLHEFAKHKEAKLLQIQVQNEKTEKQKLAEKKVEMSSTSKRIVEELDRVNIAMSKFKNYGEYLYEEAKNSRERIEEMAKQQEVLNAAKIEAEATFHPKINHDYKMMSNNNNRDILERVMEKTIKRPKPPVQDKQQDLDLTFKPRISKESERLMKEKKLRESYYYDDRNQAETEDLHMILFKEAEIRRKKKQEGMFELPAEATFKPDIGRKQHHRSAEGQEEFINRLVNSKKESEKHIAQLRSQLYSNYDHESGRELFKPVITKYPLSNRDSVGGQELEDKSDQRARFIEAYQETIKRMANQSHITQNSQKIAQIAKIRKATEMFEFFDVDQDGYINIKETVAYIKYLEPELVADLVFVFRQFNDDAMISMDEFVHHLLTRVEDTKTQGAKTTLLTSFSKRNTELKKKRMLMNSQESEFNEADMHLLDNNYTFKPQVNKLSTNLAITKDGRRAKSAGKIHEILLREKEKWNAKKELLKKELMQNELKECTFYPDTSKTTGLNRRSHSPDSAQFMEKKYIEPRKIEEIANRLSVNRSFSNTTSVDPYPTSEQKELEQHCTFTPKINKSHSSISKPPSIPVHQPHPTEQTNMSYSEIYVGRTWSPSKKDPNYVETSGVWRQSIVI